MPQDKKLLIISQENYLKIAREIVNATGDFISVQCWSEIQSTSEETFLEYDHILLAGESKQVLIWQDKLQAFERKLLFLSLTKSNGMAYKFKANPKVPENYNFDEVM